MSDSAMSGASVLRVLLVGATGLVGRAVIDASVSDPQIRAAKMRLVALARREIALPQGARMELVLADPQGWPEMIARVAPDVLVIALGTTIATVGGDRDAFRAVDHDLVLTCARAAHAGGVRHAIAVSSVGADPDSRNFYLSVKGQTEVELARIGFARLDILRPGMLRGRRAGRLRPAEQVGQWLSPLIDPLLKGKWTRFRSIRASDLARVILDLTRAKQPGLFIHHSYEFRAILRR
ncbi:NAD(P)H-binding protein [Novosphingobium sp. FKTRR1]|uniref:NAD(P)H-binding protein n=1 Tax=Novosphingobium sp. FKTRR1 TaxID=2879118 RepID=UPI001CF037D8|nr:NAD(P)H-binding protein [Novosphingobium sp. FKTRR1]